jgi:hypothetical protein
VHQLRLTITLRPSAESLLRKTSKSTCPDFKRSLTMIHSDMRWMFRTLSSRASLKELYSSNRRLKPSNLPRNH